ncbi:alpha/beta fold hydrolase [Salinicola rhizosphaerae]|uniref:Hydrolase n=1 Tax=Salinicola rhizosphaerae TaxID=1443141 RepID=A0ABQ3E9Z2_9GAMM|nr:alpha/beta hydrolase [Salinicola rhizosphaerae]GHB29738.1 hydrolase [Salinicola rhizosphaerae]
MRPRDLRLADGRLAALSWGEEGAPIWLALHGWLDNAASFSRLAPTLAATLGVRIVALDLPGHGHSQARGAGADYPLWGYLPDVLDALEALDASRVTLFGHSMGAGIATMLAAAAPECVARLVLIDGLASTTDEPAATVGQLQAGLRARRRPARDSRGYATVEEALAARVRGGVTRLDAETARPIVERNLQRDRDGRFHWRTDPRLSAPSLLRWSPAQMLETMAAVDVPTLLLQASAGVLNERAHFHEACRRIARLTRRVLGGGHHLHLERATVARVGEEIVRWQVACDRMQDKEKTP